MNCIDLMSKTSNNAKLQKWSNYDEVHGFDVKTNKNVELRRKPFKTTQIYKSNQIQWIASIWCQNDKNELRPKIQNTANLQKWSNYDELHRFDVKNIKQRKTTKVIKLRWSAWIWRQNEQKCFVTSETIQNNANLQKLSKYNELHRFDVKTIKNVELRPKPSKHSQNKSDQITMNCIDLTSKRSKMFSYVKPFKTTQTYKSNQITMNCIDLMSKTSNNAKLQKWSNYDEVHGFDVKTNKNVELRRKPFKTTQIYKSYQSTMNCIDLMSKRTKMLSYVPNHSKQRKTTKVIKLRWIASIWFDVKTNAKMLSYVANHSKQRKSTKVIKLQWIASIWCQKHQTTQNYKSDQITTKCMDLTSKRTKMFCYVGNHSKQRKTTKVIKLRWIASIWRQNDQKCLVTSQTIQNNSNLQKYSNYNELHRFDVKNIKQRKTTKVIKLRRSAWIWRQSEQKCFVTSETIENNANLQKLSKYNEVHGFDVKTNKNVELRRKPFKTTQI